MSDKERGLFKKFVVSRYDRGYNTKHDDCEFFVLDWAHDKFTVVAMRAYADACEKEFPMLALDIRSKIEEYK